ncbi:MAG: UDP-3-O-(3-hydroxymyristoyl)glucosamine N-acyltransferase [Rhodospirillaceae bacterium]|nr:UDP-3-O-(3-hydroxymyristoyl)glucosamine N-acyltransferase [Rhodospirillaceae bacterium]
MLNFQLLKLNFKNWLSSLADPRFFKNVGPFSLNEILSHCNIYNNELDGDLIIDDVSYLGASSKGKISFMDDSSLINDLKKTKTEFCFISNEYITYAPKSISLVICDQPRSAYALAAQKFYPDVSDVSMIYKNSSSKKNLDIHNTCKISDSTYISEGVKIGKNSIIGPNTVIGKGVIIGNNCSIHSNTTITHCLIGNNVEILPGTRIGQDGFGFIPNKEKHIKIPQLGRVLIGDNVNIGSNCTIDRGAGPDTVIGNGCFLDNLVHIAHNVILGSGCIIAGQVGIAGSTILGDYVMIAGQGGISGHLKIGSGTKFAVKSGVINDIPPGGTYGGFPAVPIRDWHRQTLTIKNISKINRGKK